VYSIGIDFGTESGRVLLLDLRSGVEAAVVVVPYASGVIDRVLPGTDEALPGDWALQDPDDWRAVVSIGVPAVLDAAGVAGRDVIGIGIDFTCCTVLPVSADGTPLCALPAWRGRPHAWPKLWKHHAAQSVADRLNEVARERHEPFLARYGGKISSEWYFPKLIELWLDDREIYDAASGFIEACDWIVWHLTGRERRAACSAGYKALWSPVDGLPSTDFFTAAYPGFDQPAEKLGGEFTALGERAGLLAPELAAQLGLEPSVAVAVGNVDSFVSVPGAGVLESTSFLIVIGTSICDVVIHPDEILLPGITGVVKDGVLPGLYGYEAGQAAVGDMLAWFVGLVAGARESDRYVELEREAAVLAPGACGLLALDWWNGNRTILADADLSGRDLPRAARVDSFRQSSDRRQLRGARLDARPAGRLRWDRREEPADDAAASRHERTSRDGAGLDGDSGPWVRAVRRRRGGGRGGRFRRHHGGDRRARAWHRGRLRARSGRSRRLR
jgi:L-ribulokinase